MKPRMSSVVMAALTGGLLLVSSHFQGAHADDRHENGEAQYADLNGDGKADLIFQGLDNLFWVSLSTGAGFTEPTLWVQHGGEFLDGQAQYVDLNGDGKGNGKVQGWEKSFLVSVSIRCCVREARL